MTIREALVRVIAVWGGLIGAGYCIYQACGTSVLTALGWALVGMIPTAIAAVAALYRTEGPDSPGTEDLT